MVRLGLITRDLSAKIAGKVLYFTRNSDQPPINGCYIKENAIWYRDASGQRPVLPLREILLPGVPQRISSFTWSLTSGPRGA